MITSAVRDVIIRWRQKNTSLFAQIMWVGFRQSSICYSRQERNSGQSKWTWSKKVKLFIDSFASFSFLPIRLISYAGLVLAGSGVGFAAFTLLHKSVSASPLANSASLTVVLLVLSGLQMLAVGVIGEYLWRVADEVRGAPSFIIASRLGEAADFYPRPIKRLVTHDVIEIPRRSK
jgi:dolichol-phosphate mannosyltransferase